MPDNKGLRLASLKEIHLMEFPDQKPLVEGLLDEGDSLLLTGPTAMGKSLLCLELALCVGGGIKFLGKFDVPKARRVLIIQSENALTPLKVRLAEIIKNNPAMEKAMENVMIAMKGDDCRLSGKITDNDFFSVMEGMMDKSKPELLILDPLISYHAENENDNAAVRRILDRLSELAANKKCSLVITHHHGKSRDNTGVAQSRGASALPDWARCVLTLTQSPQRSESRKLVTCQNSKNSNHEPVPTMLLEIVGPRIAPTTPDMKCPPAEVANVLRELGGEAKSKNQLIEQAMKRLGTARRTVQSSLNTAEEMGLVKFERVSGGSIKVVLLKEGWNG